MSKQNQPAAKPAHKTQPKPTPVPITEMSKGISLVDIEVGRSGFVGNLSLLAQTKQLGDQRLQLTHRQVLASGIGRIQGNRKLLRVMSTDQKDAKLPNQHGYTAASTNIQKQDDDKTSPRTYQIEFDGKIVSLSEEEYQRIKRREIHNLDVMLNHVLRLAQSGLESQQDFLTRIRNWAGVISDILAVNSPPSLEIWTWPIPSIKAGKIALSTGNLQGAVQQLKIAERSLYEAQKHWNRYVEKNIGGSERAIAGLEMVRDTSFAIAVGAATIATGGAASAAGVGLLGQSTLAGGIALAGSVTKETVTQLSELGHGLRNDFDIVDVLSKGASDAVPALVGAFAGGALTPHIQKLFGSYLGKAAPELLEELGRLEGLSGPLPKDYFFTTGQKVLTDFLGSLATSPLQTSVRIVVDRLTGKSQKNLTPVEFVKQVFDEMGSGGIDQLLFSMILHSKGGLGPSQRPPKSVSSTESQTVKTDKGLADQGYRPKSGERTMTRDEWTKSYRQERVNAKQQANYVDYPFADPTTKRVVGRDPGTIIKEQLIETWQSSGKDGSKWPVKVVPVQDLKGGTRSQMTGYFTEERFILGRTPEEIADILGLSRKQVRYGVKVYRAKSLPQGSDFELKGQTIQPEGKAPPARWRELDLDYPPGVGVPQWKMKANVAVSLEAPKTIKPAEKYLK